MFRFLAESWAGISSIDFRSRRRRLCRCFFVRSVLVFSSIWEPCRSFKYAEAMAVLHGLASNINYRMLSVIICVIGSRLASWAQVLNSDRITSCAFAQMYYRIVSYDKYTKHGEYGKYDKYSKHGKHILCMCCFLYFLFSICCAHSGILEDP